MGGSLTRVCEDPMKVCQGGDLVALVPGGGFADHDGECLLKVRCTETGQVIRFASLGMFLTTLFLVFPFVLVSETIDANTFIQCSMCYMFYNMIRVERQYS